MGHEITDGLMLHQRLLEAVEVYHTIWPHETLGQVPPLPAYLAQPNLHEAQHVSAT